MNGYVFYHLIKSIQGQTQFICINQSQHFICLQKSKLTKIVITEIESNP